MIFFFKLIFKELKASPKFSLLFILNASFGLCGFIALETFKNSISNALDQHSKSMLGADLVLSSRRPLTNKERKIVFQTASPPIQETQVTQLYSMASSKEGGSRLVHIKAVEKNYPFYGKLHLQRQGPQGPSARTNLHQANTVWVYPELLLQLNLKIGDSLFINQKPFTITDTLNQDPSHTFTSSLAPRVYISQKNLKTTGLVQMNSLARHSLMYRIPQPSIETLRDQIFSQINDPQVQVRSHKNAGAGNARALNYLNDFMSLTTLCALFLSCIGLSFLFRAYFREKVYPTALLISLGMPRIKALTLYLIEMIILGSLSFITALLLSYLMLPVLAGLTSDFFPISFQFHWKILGSGFLLALFTPVWISLPAVWSIQKIKLTSLLHPKPEFHIPFQRILIFMILSLAGLWGLAVWQSHSLRIGSLFMGVFLAAGLLLTGAAWILLIWIGKPYFLNKISSLALRWSLRDISRLRWTSFSCFLSLGLGVFLLSLIPQIQKSLHEYIKAPSQQPSLFLFDIQEGQIEGLKSLLKKQSIPMDKITPLIQARLTGVNGKPFNKGRGSSGQAFTREEERENRFRNRGMNLTYRSRLYSSETILKGKDFFSTPPSSIPDISLETRFARRLGLNINDRLDFEIEGQKVQGIVQNIRQVNWLSFDPNFFIVFSDQSLDSFFKTFLATLPRLSQKQKNKAQRAVISQFPNISMVDVSKLTQKLLSLSRKMGQALSFMTLSILLAGVLVFYSISSFQMTLRQPDIRLLQSIGTPFKAAQSLFFYPMIFIASSAVFWGFLLSIIGSYWISFFFFDSIWSVSTIKIQLFWIFGGVFLIITGLSLGLKLQKSVYKSSSTDSKSS